MKRIANFIHERSLPCSNWNITFFNNEQEPKKECMPLTERGKEYTLNCFYIGTYYWECIFLREIYMNHKLSDNDKMRFEKWIIGSKTFVDRSLPIIPIHIPSSTSYSIFGTMDKVLRIILGYHYSLFYVSYALSKL